MTHRASYLVSLGEPNVYHDSVWFTRIEGFTWRVSDCEGLLAVKYKMMGLVLVLRHVQI